MLSFSEFCVCEALDIQDFPRSLGIDRKQMPQVAEENYPHMFAELKETGIKITKKKVRVSDLKPTQKSYNVLSVTFFAEKKPSKLYKPLMISKDMYLLDGHHRWAALMQIDKNTRIEAVILELDALAALDALRNYSRVEHRATGTVTDRARLAGLAA